jgi:subtilisin family serine protease
MKRISIVVVLLVIFSQNPAIADSASDVIITNQSYSLIGLAEVRAQGLSGKGQTIVVIDSGVQIDHPYIKDALVDGFCSSESACGSNFGKSGIAAGSIIKNDKPLEVHGSMVGGIATGRANAEAPGGIAPGANLISINNFEGQSEGIVRALDWVLSIKDKYQIVAVSASFGVPDGNERGQVGPCLNDARIKDRIVKLAAAGIAFVAASGNESLVNNLIFPACLPEAFAIGATNEAGAITTYSNIAEKIAVLAPATVIGANSLGGYFIGGGTSSAAPLVAGALALLREAKPNASLSELRKALASTPIHVDDTTWKNIPVLYLPAAIKALKSGDYTNMAISKVAVTSGAKNLELEAALAREELLNKDLVKLKLELATAYSYIDKIKTITCTKGKAAMKITSVNPKCPTGYKKKV